MIEIRTNEEILREANVRLCRLCTWSNYKGLGFHLAESTQPPHLISLVESNSPAAAGGLKIWDVLLAVNNKIVFKTDYKQVIMVINAAQNSSRPIELLVVEQHSYKILKKKNVTINSSLAKVCNTPIRMPDDYIQSLKCIPRQCYIHLQSKDTNFGFEIINGHNNIGVYIQEVIPDSPAFRAGLRKSDRIIEINDKFVDKYTTQSIMDKLNRAKNKKTVKLLVADTQTYAYSVLNEPCNVFTNENNATDIDKKLSSASSVTSSRNNSESLTSNKTDQSTLSSSFYEYISLDNDHVSNQMSTSPVNNTNDHSPLNHNNESKRFLDIQLFDYELQEITVEYEYPNDCNLPTPSGNKPLTKLQVKQNDNSDYLEPSDIILSMESDQRFIDAQNEPLTIFPSFEGFSDTPLLPLNTAIENLEKIIPEIKQNALIALERSIQLFDKLTSDESASIQLYTMECMKFNAVLRNKDRNQLIPYFPYFKLVLTALSKLESIQTIVWRGAKADLRAQYEIGKVFVWWGFSSCMRSCDILESDKYLGTKGERTLFHIECKTGKSISHENEILLLPATQFQVINQDKRADNIYIIYLKEIQSSNSNLQEFINNHKMESSIVFPEQLLTINDMYLIANELQINKYWYKISLHRMGLNKEYLKILMQSLKSNVTINCLNLSSNQLDDDTCLILTRALKTNICLENIDLTDNQITEIGARSFAKMLGKNKTLLTLNLSSNPIGDNGMISVICALQHNNTLKSLYLNRTQLTDKGGQEMGIYLESNTNLKGLYLNENNLEDGGIISIARSLMKNQQMNTLHVAMNNITHLGAEKIALLLKQTTCSLSELNISDNPLQDLGITSIAQAVSRNTTLIELYLDSIEITIDGLRELVKMLRINNTLKHLSLNKNELNDNGMILLLDGLEVNKILTHLYLNNNKLTDQCISNIINMLKTNKTLKYLYLSDNQITEQGELIFNQTITTNSIEIVVGMNQDRLFSVKL